ncbi:MAG: hypothetical protein ACP6IY_10020 [Promethearchaeia archaeon]
MAKEIKIKLEEIPENGCLIKDNYVICKDANGNIRVSKVEGTIPPSEIEKWLSFAEK